MLTPRFEWSQTEDEVTVVIYAPYANIKDTEIYVDGSDFRFYSTPYYLRLNLPGEIEENNASTGNYNCENGDFTLKFSKVNKGENFENLDMITNLLVLRKEKKNLVPCIDVISTISNRNVDEDEVVDVKNDSCDSNNSVDQWYTNQDPLMGNVLSLNSQKYGFANKVSALAIFEDAWIDEIINLPFPNQTLPEERQKLREENELKSFNEEHYMADLMEPEYVQPFILFESKWEKLTVAEINLSDEEKDLLKELPNKEYLLDQNEIQSVLYSMIDILFAYCYNYRTTLGESTIESSWTINKLSSTLCWFQNFTNLHDVLLSSIRRSLIYPLIRNWDLSKKVWQDVKNSVKLGKKFIIKCLCEVYSLFNNSYEPRYILNQLYIKDYLVWLQQISNSVTEELYSLMNNINIKKEEVGLDLVEIEEAAHSVKKEDLIIENELYTLPDDLEKLMLKNDKNASENMLVLLTTSDSDSDTGSTSSSSNTNSSLTSSSIDNNSSRNIMHSNENNGDSNCQNSSDNCNVYRIISSNNSDLDSDDNPN